MATSRYIATILFCFSLSLFYYCSSSEQIYTENDSPYLNHHDTVEYVGGETCRGCHADKFESFMHTGMGESFGDATKSRSKSKIDEHTLIFDSINNYYYKPFWKDDSLYVHEFRLDGKDTLYSRVEQIKYIIGSGHHTNSHIYEKNGYLYQAPITFYTQDQKWDFAPGFAGGFNSRFDRIIGTECMNCHNSYSDQPEGSENKYEWVAQGISCERCHGPGEAHVKLKTAGELIDTSKYVDYSIVNPAKLDRKLQMNVCQRCHVQGIAELLPGKSFYDFKPGQHLDSFMNVFIPRYDGNNTKFIMASQADRLTQSKCYTLTDMTCISCHNPHISTRVTPIDHFNQKCTSCHPSESDSFCTLNEGDRMLSDNNCSGCHMPESPSIDIPHVTVTDHLIRIPPKPNQKEERFTHLENVISDKTDPAIRALGYLSFYEKFTQNSALIDSAALYAGKNSRYPEKNFQAKVWINFIRSNYKKVSDISLKHSTDDPWTLYRIGESFTKQRMHKEAEVYYLKAVSNQQFNLEFQNKLASSLLNQMKLKEAKDVLNFIIKENDQHISALTNMGFTELQFGNIEKAQNLYEKVLKLNPDHIPCLLNMAGLYLVKSDKRKAKHYLNEVISRDKDNFKANQILKELKRI